MRISIGDGRDGEWFSGNVKIANRVRGVQRRWKERKSKLSLSFETSGAIYQSIKRLIPEYLNLQQHRLGNFEYHNMSVCVTPQYCEHTSTLKQLNK